MSIKLTSAETGRNKSAIAAAAGSGNKVSVAPFTSTYIKNTPSGWPTVNVGSIDTTNSTAIGQSVTVDAVYVTDSNWNILDDTALSSSGGFLKIIGTGFKAGAVAYIQGVPATSTVVTSSTELRVTTPALTSGTLQVYVVNPDNTVGIRISGIIVSGVPSWTTTSPLPDQPLDIAFSLQLTAVSDSTVAYSLQNGSSLPSGVSLNSSGVLSGTVTGLLVDTTYSFTLVATDLELQDTAKVFSVTISFGDAYFKQSTLVITGEANSTPWIVDGSNTNKTLTIGGDTRPSAFSPYNNNWSVYFDGTGDYLSNASGNIIDFGTGDFTVEYWWYPTAAQTAATNIHVGGATSSAGLAFGYAASGNLTANTSGAGYTSTVPASLNQWQHIAWTRQSGSLKLYKNGVLGYTTTVNTNLTETGCGIYGTKNGTFVSTAGYMSNVRVVKGTVVYTENFTPPTSPLTATQSANTNGIPSAAISSGTTLLALQSNRYIDKATANSGSGFSLTKNGEPLIKSFAPFTETDLISGSAYFDGNGDSIIIPDNPNLELGSGDFCVECWIYPTDVGSTAIIIDKRSGTYGPLLLWRSTNIVQLYMSASGSAWNLVNGSTVGIIETNQWYHIAVYRVGSSIYTAFNGVVTLQNASGGAAPQDNSGNWGIGTQPDGTTNPFTGYIADMRFVIGSGVYASTNFTPPSTSLTNVTNTKLLTLQTRIGENNQRFIDEGGAKALITRFGNATQGAFTPYSPSGWSAYFDGSGDYLTVADNASLELGSSNFCIEMLIFTTAVSTDAILITKRASSVAYAPILIYRNSAAIRVGMSSNGSSWDIVDPTTTTLGTVNTNQWYHISVYRIGTAIYGSLNGTITTLNPNTSATALNNTDPYYIGSDSNLSPYVGYISNLRVVIGSSVYSNTSAPSPTSSLTAVANTVLLTCQDNRFTDNSTANSGVGFTVTRVGDTKIEAFNPFRPNEPYSPTTHGGSAYFDGTGDYLTVASDTITTLGTQDFTIEFWTYVTTLATQITLIDQRTGGSEIVPWITANATTTVFGTATTNRISGSPLTTNQWNHIAVSRFSGNTRLFINGTQSGSTYVDGFTYVSGAMYIGSSYVSSQRVNGYISDFNISKTGKYTTSFTVPNTRITSTGNTLSRLEFDNAGIIDYTCKNAIETIGTVRVSTANSKYGTSSVSFNTKTDALALPVSRLNSTFLGDFTIECYVYPTDATITHWGIYDARQSGGTSDAFALSLEPLASPVSGSYRMSYYNAGYSYGTGTVLSNVWTHLAWVRSGTTLTFYVDGVAGGTVSVSGTLTGAATTNPIWIGIKDNATAAYGNIGYIDDLRITNGYARYTGNFTPPTLIPTE